MASIFNISDDIQKIYNEIEANDGEITEELEQALSTANDNLKDKVEDYYKLIKLVDYDAKACKQEIDRLTKLKKSKENLIERLKKILLFALENYGDDTKSGGKVIKFSTGQISTRRSNAVEVDEDSYKAIIEKLSHHAACQGYLNNDYETVDTLDEFIEDINSDSEFTGDKIDPKDLQNVELSINIPTNIYSLLDLKRDTLKYILKNCQWEMKPIISKTNLKSTLAQEPLSFARMVENTTVTLK